MGSIHFYIRGVNPKFLEKFVMYACSYFLFLLQVIVFLYLLQGCGSSYQNCLLFSQKIMSFLVKKCAFPTAAYWTQKWQFR